MKTKNSGWSEEARQIVMADAAAGVPASETAKKVSRTRNAVLGFRHRNGIGSINPSGFGVQNRARRQHRETRSATVMATIKRHKWPDRPIRKAKPMPIEPLYVGFMALGEFMCREIVEIPESLPDEHPARDEILAVYCGNGVQPGSSYCPWHHSINYVPAEPVSRRYLRFAA